MTPRFLDDDAGNISILFAGLALLIFGAAGIAIDYSLWNKQRAQLQEAADAAAIAAAAEFGKGGRTAEQAAVGVGAKIGALNLGDGALAGLTPAISIDATARTATAVYAVKAKRGLSAVLLGEVADIRTTATARILDKVVACIYALNPSASGALAGAGAAIVEGTNCAIQVNSSASNALTNSGTIRANHICVAGDYTGSGYTPTPETGCAVAEDPFLSTTIPEPGPCTHTGFSSTSDVWLSPGVYCGGITLSSSAAASLSPGVYHVVDGPIRLTGSASIVGTDVVFVLSGTAALDIAGTGQVRTTPISWGDLAGYSIVRDRAAPAGVTSIVRGGGRFEFPGIIYLPGQRLEITGRAEGNIHTPTYSALVADTITVKGTGDLIVTADTTLFSSAAARKLSLVQVALIR